MSTIPASFFVKVYPNVLPVGGDGIDLNGLFLSHSTRLPTPGVSQFSSQTDVEKYFGAGSVEAQAAVNYFLGWDNSARKPGVMSFVQYPSADVAAWLRGAKISSKTASQLQGISGTLSVVVDGKARSGSINLSSATSFSAAAALIETALNSVEVACAAFTGSISGTTLTVTAVSSGTLAVGQRVKGAGVTTGTIITALGTGEGLTGTYTVSESQTVSSESMTTVAVALDVSFDSIAGALQITSGITGPASTIEYATGTAAAALGLSSGSAAILSQGSLAGATITPSAFMNGLIDSWTDWATFTTLFDPDNGVGNTQKLLFAAWTNSTNNRYAYIPTDTDQSPTVSTPAPTSLSALLEDSEYSGTAPVYRASGAHDVASFIMGTAASIDFNAHNGRITFAHKGQAGIVSDVTNESVAARLEANGYNFYYVAATATSRFRNLFPGVISGKFLWLDSYINQIWLNANLQQSLMTLLTQVNSIPYNVEGYSMIEAACLDPILRAKNFGAIREGIQLSSQQKAIINSMAGANVADAVTRAGYYLQIVDANPVVRQARKSPPINFWYADGQSVHRIEVNSIEVM